MFHLNLLFLGSFILLLRLFIPIQSNFYYYLDYLDFKLRTKDSFLEFDFIVVGSGSGGSAVANALSRHSSVFLIEAGGDPLVGQSIPAFVSEFLHRPQTDWMYETTIQTNSHFGHSKTNISKWPRGLGIGGTSNLHFTLYSRSHPLDYDNWAEITRDPEWLYENLLTYFKKSLNYNGKFKSNEKHYGKGGKEGAHLSVESKPPELEPLLPFALEAGMEIGLGTVNDQNGPQRAGTGSVEFAQKDGARCGAYNAFIQPILHRTNLVISRYSLATKIHLDKSLRATGVWMERHGRSQFMKARKEVIISAGAIESPKLLMLSGIGPENLLKKVNIKPRVILPVGQNLIDHFSIYLPPIILHKSPTGVPMSPFLEHDLNPRAFYNYIMHGQGPFTLSSPNNFAAYLNAPTTPSEEITTHFGQDWPNIQAVAVNMGVTHFVAKNLPLTLGWKVEESKEMWENVIGKPVLLLGAVLARPLSKGTITLINKDPMSRPLIDPNYLAEQQDLDTLVSGIKLLVKLVEETKAFSKFGARMVRIGIPSCQESQLFSDPYWKCYVRHLGTSGFHPVGSCRMGRGQNDPRAVVDSSLRVLHTRGLRVADASVMPEIVNGNPNAAIFMIGEKAGDMIRHYWAQQYLICPRMESVWKWREEKGQCFYSRMV